MLKRKKKSDYLAIINSDGGCRFRGRSRKNNVG